MMRRRLAMCDGIPLLKAALLKAMHALPAPQYKARTRAKPQYSAAQWPVSA